MDAMSNFKLGTTQISYDYWTIKNLQEMRGWIMKTIPHLIYNEQFLDTIAELEMQRLINLRLNRSKIADDALNACGVKVAHSIPNGDTYETRAKLEEAKDILHSA
jgi:hypothetical protein